MPTSEAEQNARTRTERVLHRVTLTANVVTAVMLVVILVTMLIHVATGHHDPLLDAVIGNG